MRTPENPHRVVALIAILTLFAIFPLSIAVVVASLFRNPPANAGTPSIDISAQAVQKVHTTAVPHTDSLGKFKTVYDQNSFLPLGIYNPVLCTVVKNLSWTAQPGYTGEYRIKVHYGSSRDAGSYLLADIDVGTVTSAAVGNLPPSSNLHYSIWLHGTQTVIDEGNFTSDVCANLAENNNLDSIKGAGYNLAILEKNVYPDVNYLTRAQQAQIKLLLDIRDRPNNTFANLKDSPNIFGFYVGDDDLARAKATGADPAPVYSDIKGFADSLDGQTDKVVIAAEPDIESNAGQTWLNWYNLFDAIGNVSFHYNYPKSSSPLFPWQAIKTVADTVSHQVSVNGDNRPSWFISQAINLKWVVPLEFPTAQESRAMKYAAIIHGATGIFDFSYDSWFRRQPKGNPAPENQGDINWWDRHAGIKALTPVSYAGGDKWAYSASAADQMMSVALWNGSAVTNSELESLAPVILSKTLTDDYKVYVDQAPNYSPVPIRTILKSYNGELYLLAVNINNEPITAKFVMTGKNIISAQVMFESRNAQIVSGNEITEVFSPFDVNVYKLVLDDLPVGKFKAQYFNTTDFTDLVLTREENVAKTAGSANTVPVGELVNDGNFSVKWEGKFNMPAAKYRFNSQAAVNSSRVYIDDVLKGQANGLQNILVDIPAGLHRLRFEFVRSNVTANYSYLSNFFNRQNCYDLTADSQINSQDLGIVARHFSQTGESAWDINGDNNVNAIDNSQIAQKFGLTCPH